MQTLRSESGGQCCLEEVFNNRPVFFEKNFTKWLDSAV
jgi:hypothetical protein